MVGFEKFLIRESGIYLESGSLSLNKNQEPNAFQVQSL